MLRIINNFANGYVAIPVIATCRQHGVFELLSGNASVPCQTLVAKLGAHRGYLRASLHLLESLDWVEHKEGDEYQLKEAATLSAHLPSDILDLFHFPIDEYLLQTGAQRSLRRWIEMSREGWGLHGQDVRMAEFLDGVLLTPLLVSLGTKDHALTYPPAQASEFPQFFTPQPSSTSAQETSWAAEDHPNPRNETLGGLQRAEVFDLFQNQGWLYESNGNQYYTEAGRFVLDRVPILATVYSYRALLSRLPELLFGDCKSVFARDANQRESHVDRTLNVMGSGFQHDRYFSDMDEMITSVFNRAPIDKQPDYIADMGCGNGALLQHIYATIQSKTLRGQVLHQFPIQLIGIDFNEEALEQTKRTLDGLPYRVLQGDIGDPQRLVTDLTALGIDVRRILHVRSFLDHDRPFIPPTDVESLSVREKAGSRTVWIDEEGEEIPSAIAVQSLVEHLSRWSSVLNEHGLMVLEAHSLEPLTIRRYLDQTESLHFDAYHRFSHQLLVAADTFLMAAAEAGLFPHNNALRKYPKTLPLCRISLNHLEPRPYKIRFARETDLSALVKIEHVCWRSSLQTPTSTLYNRVLKNPQGQLVVEMDNRVVGVLYSQRIRHLESLGTANVHTVDGLHDPTGPYVQLLGLNVLPDQQNRNLGHELLEFMLQRCRVMEGLDLVVGVTRCRDYHKYKDETELADYINRRNEHGQLWDMTLRFHETHGAKVQGTLPQYRPQDVENQGLGVVIVYSINDNPGSLSTGDRPSVRADALASSSGDTVSLKSIRDFVVKAVSSLLGAGVDPDSESLHQPLMEMGLDSADLLELEVQLSDRFKVPLESTFFFKCNTIDKIVDYLRPRHHGEPLPGTGGGKGTLGDEVDEGIAIVGVACRLPGGVRNLEQLWELLSHGTSVVGRLPADRWSWPSSIQPEGEHKGIDQGGFLDDISGFDPLFFRISPKEAEWMDPQQRILLELSWECLEDAGYPARDLAGTKTGVFIGASGSDYARLLSRHLDEVDANYGTGTSMAALPNRISYFYDFQGPSVQVDTACSSSLVAVHQAVAALERGECDAALVGGVHIMCHPHDSLAYYKAGMLSRDGQCKTFDKEANGYVRGEGAVMLLLKPLQKALASSDTVLAVIRGTATNHGGQASGLTVPSPDKQAAVIVDAFRKARVSPARVGYIEAHGTGTPLGDPIEMEGLQQAFRQLAATDDVQPVRDIGPHCGLGSIKTNIGHLEAAAGLAGLLKVVLSLKHQMMPPSLHLQEVNPRIELAQSPFYFVRQLQPWTLLPQQGSRTAAIASFGSGGTNAYVVVEEFVEKEFSTAGNQPSQLTHPGPRADYAVCLSAKTPDALERRERELLSWLQNRGAACSVAQLSLSLLVGREHFRYRSAYVVKTLEELQAKLREALVQRQVEDHQDPAGGADAPRRPRHELEAVSEALWAELRAGDGDTMAKVYLAGFDLDWKALLTDTSVPRLSLPTYPFARERYWVPERSQRQEVVDHTRNVHGPAEDLVADPSTVKCEPGTRDIDVDRPASLTLLYPTWKEDRERSIGAMVAHTTADEIRHLVMVCEAAGVSKASLEAGLDGAECVVLESTAAEPGERFEGYATLAFAELQGLLRQGLKGPVWVQIAVLVAEDQQRLLSGLVGLLRTANREYPELMGQLVELDAADGVDEKQIASRLMENCPIVTDHVRYRDGKRCVVEWVHVQPQAEAPAAYPMPWRDEGIYLITGGAGGLGRIFAYDIAQKVKNPVLLLVGRSGLSATQQNLLRELAQTGAKVHYRQVNVTDQAAVESLLQGVRAEFGGLHGILHCAGVLRDNFLVKKTQVEWQEVLGPKVRGLVNLDRASQGLKLDWLILCSSWASVTGNPGQADYASANAFMDAYASYRNTLVRTGRREGHTLAIQWPLWHEGGMKVAVETQRRLEQSLGMQPLQTEAGIKALYRGLSAGTDQVLVRVETGILPTERPQLPRSAGPGSDRVRNGAGSQETGQYGRQDGAESTRVLAELLRIVARLLKVKPHHLEADVELGDYGFDSILFTALANEIHERFGPELSPAVFFEHSTLQQVADYLLLAHGVSELPTTPLPALTATALTIPAQSLAQAQAVAAAPLAKTEPPPSHPQTQGLSPDAIAIVGVSCQFPGARDIHEFWENLKAGTDCVREIPKGRWDGPAAGLDQAADNQASVRWGGFIDGIDTFDPLFFGISPAEAGLMDPQHRLLLMHAWKAIEDAGYAPGDLSGTQTGVFTAIAGGGYSTLLLGAESPIQGHYATGNMPSVGPNRISYFFNLHGPSEPVETACSSGLVALHRAVSAILDGSCEMALAGGVNLLLTPDLQLSFEQAGMLSKDGRCKTFSDKADGYVRGEGIGMLLLKRLEDAKRAGDCVYAVIRSTAVNHGGRANSLTAPNPKAQTDLLVTAYRKARIDPRTVTYIETHGTGTPLGDPIEINALKTAFRQLVQSSDTPETGVVSCGLGSVKTNIGHLELAAGLAGVIKVVLQMQHKTLVKNLHFTSINPHIELTDSPFYIVQERRPWEALKDAFGRELPRRAGVSSFGFGGANAHLVLEEYVDTSSDLHPDAMSAVHPYVILLSAKREAQLKEQAGQLLSHLQEQRLPEAALADLAYTLQVGREPMSQRLAMVATSSQDLEHKLRGFLNGLEELEGVYQAREQTRDEVLALFSSEAELLAVVDNWIADHRYAQLCKLWVNGLKVDWSRWYQNHKPRRLHLPTYPFAQESYWVPQLGRKTVPLAADSTAEPPARTVNTLTAERPHPLVQERISDLPWPADPLEQGFRSTFTGQEFFLKDHVVRGRRILPGVTYLEMARAAAEQALMAWRDMPPRMGQPALPPWLEKASVGHTRLRLSQVVLMRPFGVDGDKAQVYIRLRPQTDSRISFEVYHPGVGIKEPVVYSQGRVELLPGEAAPVLDLLLLQTRCHEAPLTAEQWYQTLQRTGFDFGPAHQGIQQVYLGQGQALARLALPASVWDTQDDFVLHPSVLDSALQASVALMAGVTEHPQAGLAAPTGEVSVGGFLPFAFEDIEILGRSPTTAWALIRTHEGPVSHAQGVRKLDIDLCGDDGKVCVRMRGVTLKSFVGGPPSLYTAGPSATATRESEGENLTLLPVWDAVAMDLSPVLLAPQTLSQTGHLVVMGGTEEQRRLVQSRYPHAHPLAMESADSIDILVKGMTGVGPISHVLWLAPVPSPSRVIDESIIAGQRLGVIQLFRTVKALLHLNYGVRNLRFTVITCQAQQVLSQEAVHSVHASVIGFAGTVAREFPQWQMTILDMPSEGEWPLADLLAGLGQDQAPGGLAYRRGMWYRQRLIPVQPTASAGEPPYRQGGVYVVVGGAGGIGRVWSEHVLKGVQAQVVWLGRRPMDEDIQARIADLARFGPAPRYFAVDAADLSELGRVYKAIKREFAAVHGVVHSAVELHDESLETMSEERFQAVLKAKLDVSVRLAQVFQEEPLDFMLFFSSLNSFLNTPGQGNYNAGSVFMDAFARELASHRSCQVKVMNWGYWGQTGVVASSVYRDRMVKQGIGSIGATEAMAALDDLLAGPLNQVVFMKATPELKLSAVSWGETIRVRPSAMSALPTPVAALKRRIASRMHERTLTTDQQSRNSTASPEVGHSMLFGGVAVNGVLQQAAASCLDVDPQEIDLNLSLSEYGFDRVTLTQLVNEINAQFELQLTPSIFGYGWTLKDLADYLAEQVQTKGVTLDSQGGASR